jgi:hypothetical protein
VSELGIPYSGDIPSTAAGVKLPEVWLNVKVDDGEFRARFPEIKLLAAKLIVPPTWIPRLVSVIERTPVLETEPPVRRARVGVRAGLRASVMFMSPVLLPFNAPMRSVTADTLFTSADVSDRRNGTSVPSSITQLSDLGAMVTDPLRAAMLTLAVVLKFTMSACKRTFPLLEVTEAEFTNVPAR